ncbi:helix-turn-helix domain-containing protein [Lutibacter sp.]|uniref:helix-turn-helix domain-containing protein n=1 Tax=Lutibacter sp. TaxID=1925666 RepID=UPI0027340712|nr:helix-turn-helix domain-containing protein [Lutibacter sp.]MDP3311790.1 helix-turn-helix domain-containing protein [Lutibacter sp.]
MKQPDLGKKISELRLSKGLTQIELAEKCNLSLRTIQRIESAEVTPRSYTIKLIFENLDYEIYNSFGKFSYKLDRIAYRFKIRLEQFYKYIIDLFNLKTNTMKKLTILSIPFFALITFLLFSYNSNVNAQNRQTIMNKFEDASSNSKFMQLFNSGEIDSLGMLYLNDASLIPDFPSSIVGRENIIGYYRQLFNQGFHFTNIKTTFKVVNDSIAVERELWAIKTNSIPIITGASLIQWHYLNGQWQIENLMSKTDKVINQEVFK